MLRLSSELQLLIIAYFPPLDIYHLEETCKELRSLVQQFSGAIWRECLLRQCLLNGVFWPSYKDLSEPEQFKRAATSALRFIKTYERAASVENPTISATKHSVRIPVDNADISDFYLVQGGRFLITLGPKKLSMWDLFQTSEDSDIRLVFSHDHTYEDVDLTATRIVDATIIALIFTLQHPGHLESTASSIAPQSERNSMGYLVIEICLDNDGKGFKIGRETCLFLTAPFEPIAETFTFFTDTVLLSMTDPSNGSHISIVWDYVRNEITSIRPRRIHPILGTILRRNHIFYVLPAGIEVIEIPTLQPVKDGHLELNDEHTDFADPTQHGDSEPIVSCAYDKPLSVGRWQEWAFTGADVLNPSHLEEIPVVYEMIEDVRHPPNQFNLRHYTFHFNADLPRHSAIQLQAVYPVTCRNADFDSENLDFKPVFRRICEGRNAALWVDDREDGPTQYLAVYPPIDYSSGSSTHRRPPVFVEFDPELPDYEYSSDYLHEICSVSGTIAMLRNNITPGQPYIACCRFLDDPCQWNHTT